jgi:hypothetical protein
MWNLWVGGHGHWCEEWPKSIKKTVAGAVFGYRAFWIAVSVQIPEGEIRIGSPVSHLVEKIAEVIDSEGLEISDSGRRSAGEYTNDCLKRRLPVPLLTNFASLLLGMVQQVIVP